MQTRLVLTGDSSADEQTLQWACERRYVLSVDGRSTPLATANPETLSYFLGTLAKSFSTPSWVIQSA